MKKKFHQTMGIIAVTLLCGGTYVHAQTAGEPPLPVYTDTGDPAGDQARYENDKVVYTNFFAPTTTTTLTGQDYDAAKREAAAAAASITPAEGAIIISRADYDGADPEKRAIIDANPTLYFIQD